MTTYALQPRPSIEQALTLEVAFGHLWEALILLSLVAVPSGTLTFWRN